MDAFPIDVVATFLRAFPEELPIISVGSGSGETEYALKERLPNRRFILVDPDPESWTKYPKEHTRYLKPDVDTVDTLIQNMPELVANCVLFLPWPLPDECSYDYEAVCLLRPKGILLGFESIGASGGLLLHCWLHQTMDESQAHLYSSNCYTKLGVVPDVSYPYRRRWTKYDIHAAGRRHLRLLGLYQIEPPANVPVDEEVDVQFKDAPLGCILM